MTRLNLLNGHVSIIMTGANNSNQTPCTYIDTHTYVCMHMMYVHGIHTYIRMLGKLYFNEISIKVRAKRRSFEVRNSWKNNGSLIFCIVDYTYVRMYAA